MKQTQFPIFFPGKDRQITNTFLIIYFLFLPLKPEVSIVTLILLIAYFVFTQKIKKSINVIRSDAGLKIFIGYYLLHVVGMIYTTDFDYGLKDLQTKLSFILFPLVLSGITLKNEGFEKIKKTTIISSIVSLVILILISASRYSSSGDKIEFFYTHLSHGKHVTYLAVFINLALLFVMQKIHDRKSKSPSAIYLSVFVFLFAGILLLSARTSTIVSLLTIILYPLFVYGKQIKLKRNLLLHLILVSLSISMMYGYLHLYNRFTQVEETIERREQQEGAASSTNESPNSTNIRLNIWKNSVQLIGRNPVFGVGTGDLKEELLDIYKENNYEYGIKEKPSPHNQFLHTGVILGAIGMLYLAIMIFFPFVKAFRKKDWLYVFFIFIIFLNCMTESILEREAGILFFAAFNTCFYLLQINREKAEGVI